MIWKSTWGYKPATPVAGYSLIGFFGPVVGITISLGASNVAGETKKSFMAAAVFVAYCVGNIVGPQMIHSQQKGDHYPDLWTGLIIWYVISVYHQLCANIFSYCITILCASVLSVLWFRENRRRAGLGLNESDRDRLAFKDLTDKENLHFRYVY